MVGKIETMGSALIETQLIGWCYEEIVKKKIQIIL